MKTRTKYLILLGITVIAMESCVSNPNTKSNSNAEKVTSTIKSNEDFIPKRNKNQEVDEVKFDKSIIPGEVAYFVQTEFDSLRFPFEPDYDHYFFNGFGGDKLGSSLPYFCEGYFNNDSLIDYAVVLVKDTTSQYVIALNKNQSSFDYYILHSLRLAPGDTTFGNFVSIIINTETDREAEHILGTYYIDNESIGITDMYKSMGYWSTWKNSKNQFIDLLFD